MKKLDRLRRKRGSLADPVSIIAREALLRASHIAPLESWRTTLESGRDRPVPHFDPADAGVDARLLLLLETPGPSAASIRFVSRDNPTGTATNLRRFLSEGGITPDAIVMWNTAPWIVHAPGACNRALRQPEIAEGLATIPDLLALLPNLRVVLLAGRVAALAAPIVHRDRPAIVTIVMPHPSPTYVNTSVEVASRIRTAIARAGALIENQSAATDAGSRLVPSTPCSRL